MGLCSVWLIVLGILAMASSVSAWTEAINLSNTPICSYNSAIAIGRNGELHVVWTERYGLNQDHDIYYARSEDGGDSWSTPENVRDDSLICATPDVVVDSNNVVHIVWMNWSLGDIFWSHQLGDTWTTPVDISDQPGSEEEPTVVLDDQNNIWVFWRAYGADQQIYYNVYDGDSWSTPVNLTNDAVGNRYPDVVVDSLGHLHAVWMSSPGGGNSYIHYSTHDGIQWTSPPEQLPSLFGEATWPRVEIDSEQRPWVIWREYTGPNFNRLYCAYRDSVGWSFPSPIANDDRFTHSFIIDSRDRLHLFWSGAVNATNYSHLYYSVFDRTSWSTPFDLSDTLAQSAGWPDVIVDIEDRLHLIWSESLEWGNDKMEVFYSKGRLTDVEENSEDLPSEHISRQNFPNPFESTTTIYYTLPEAGSVRLLMCDLAGRMLANLDMGYKSKGSHALHVPAAALEKGGGAHAGVYFYRVEGRGEVVARGKLVLLR